MQWTQGLDLEVMGQPLGRDLLHVVEKSIYPEKSLSRGDYCQLFINKTPLFINIIRRPMTWEGERGGVYVRLSYHLSCLRSILLTTPKKNGIGSKKIGYF